MNKHFTWKTILGAIVALIGLISGILTIYVFLEDKKANLEFEILSSTNVLDIKANVSKLDVTYDNLSLKSAKQNLRIINIRVKNNGNDIILKEHYDLNDPIGLQIIGGKIIEIPEIIGTSNPYLTKNLKMHVVSSNEISFNDLIIEPTQYYTIKLLVLYPINLNPSVIPRGKIAGQDLIPVHHFETPKETKSFLKDLIAGNVIVQAIRIVIYGITMMVILVGSILLIENLNDFRNKITKRNLVKQYTRQPGYAYSNVDKIIFDDFVNNKYDCIVTYVKSPKLLQMDYDSYIIDGKLNHPNRGLETLINSKLLVFDGKKIEIERSFLERYGEFITFIKSANVSYRSSIIR